MARGYLRIGRWRGVPVLVHWSTPLGALLFSGFAFAPAFWLAFVGLVLVHELGHAWFVQRAGAQVMQVEAHALGGLCTWRGRTTAIDRSVIAWGGVVAQGLVFLAAHLWLAVEGAPATAAGRQVLAVATGANLWMIAINLLPVAPLDGAEAWKLFPLLRGQRRKAADARDRALRRASRVALTTADAMEDEAADASPEIQELVDSVLEKAKGPDRDDSK